MKYLKKYKLFESNVVDIESDVVDILAPISDSDNIKVEVVSYIKSNPRSSAGSSVLQIDLRYNLSDGTYVGYFDNTIRYKEELERLKEYLSSKGFRFEKWWTTHGWDRNWNSLFNDGINDGDEELFNDEVHWIELYFIGSMKAL